MSVQLNSIYRQFSLTIRIGRSNVIGDSDQWTDYSSLVPREFRVNLASLEIYNGQQVVSGKFPFTGLCNPTYVYADDLNRTNLLRGSRFLQTDYAFVFVDPLGREAEFPSSETTQNAGMSIDFILQRYASGQSLPVQNRNMRADSDHMSDSEMKQVRVISDVFEAQQYIRDVQARDAASKEAKADAPSISSPVSGSAGKEPSAADPTKQD